MTIIRELFFHVKVSSTVVEIFDFVFKASEHAAMKLLDLNYQSAQRC